MCSLMKRRWACRCALAILFLVVSLAPSQVKAGKPSPLSFTIHAKNDGPWASTPNTFEATGAIEDYGTYVEERFQDEYFDTWIRYTFTGTLGTFYVEWLPTGVLGYVQPKVTYQVDLMPGTDFYADLYGTATFKLFAKNVYDYDNMGGRYLAGRIERITIKGNLDP